MKTTNISILIPIRLCEILLGIQLRKKCNAFNQHYKSEIIDEAFSIIPKKLNFNGNICDLLEK